MNKTDRLLAIVLELQVKKTQTAEQLANTFEVSKRTIYRDIEALCETGVPLIAKQGEGYSLPDTYFLPPISFTVDEITLILLGLDFIKSSFDKDYEKIAFSAENKIMVILSEDLKSRAEILKEKFTLLSQSEIQNRETFYKDTFKELRSAILKNKVINFDYYSKKALKTRKVLPYKLIHLNNTWYLPAYCLAQKAMRNFRIDRIEQLKVLEETFSTTFFSNIDTSHQDNRTLSAKVHFDNSVKRWLKEDNFYYLETFEEFEEYLEVTLKYREPNDVLPWLLSWKSNVKVIEPESLKILLVEETKKILALY